MKNEKIVLPITEDMLRAANLAGVAALTVTAVNKAVIITETDVLECVPDELLDLFDGFGISETAVRKVLSEDNGIAEALVTYRQ